MDIANHRHRRHLVLGGAVGLGGIAFVGSVVGRPDITMTTAGALLAWIAVKASALLAQRVVTEQDPNLELLWDLLLVVFIVLGLVGVGLMSAPYN